MTTDLLVLERLVEPRGRDVLDIGCGAGALARALAVRGSNVTAVEISQEQLAPALASDEGSGVRYTVGRAEALPVADASVDVAVFMRTLHHVPAGEMSEALREARRVVRAEGVVYVAEPLTEGDFFALTRIVEDELEVRRAALAAVARAGAVGLERDITVEYDVRLCLAGLDALRARTVSVDPERAEVFDARRTELAAAFERLGKPGESVDERCFLVPTRVDVLRPARVG